MLLRVLLAGVVGGIAMFAWGFVAHTMLPLYEGTIKAAKSDEAIHSVLQANAAEPGIYPVPYMDHHTKYPPEQEAALDKKFIEWNRALVVVAEPLGTGVSGGPPAKMLISELVSDIICAFLLSLVLWKAAGGTGFIGKVWLSTLVGVIASVAIDASNHIWYGFPQAYAVASVIDHAVEFFLAGVVAAFLLKPKAQ